MRKTGKVTKSEIFLLFVTVVFLAVLLGMSVSRSETAPDGFAVITQRPPQPEQERQKLDLNEATASELEELDGIGPVLAQRILAYRESCGGFTSVEELLEIKGIGESTLENLRSLVKVEELP